MAAWRWLTAEEAAERIAPAGNWRRERKVAEVGEMVLKLVGRLAA